MSDSLKSEDRIGVLTTDDADAFYSFVEPHIPKMWRVAARLGGPSEREDIVQEALLQAWRSRSQYRADRGTVSAWLLAITSHESTRLARRLARRATASQQSSGPSSAELLELHDAMGGLSARQRLALDCFYFLGLSVAETAAAMSCSEGTVKSTLASGRDRLKTILR